MVDIYLVGGAVRDRLLGSPASDRDWVVVGADPDMMLAQGYQPVGKDFPVFLHPKTKEEYALARTERKSGKGYKGFQFHADASVTLEDDLARRDLTINAIAQASDGTLIDPFHGQVDLENKILRHVSPAFVEDPLRVLRVARFAARLHHLGFSIAEETEQLMRAMVRGGELTALVAERVWQELDSTLAEHAPQVFLQVLRSCGALAILFPELDALYGVPNPPVWHPEIDSGVHTEMVLQAAAKISNDKVVRFAALMHDLGKGVTPIALWPSHRGHEQTGQAALDGFCERYRVPRDYIALAKIVMKNHGKVHRIEEMTAKRIVKLLEETDAFRRPKRFEKFILACMADSRGRTGYEKASYPQHDLLEHAFTAAKSVDIAAIVATGVQGEALKNEIHRQRVAAVGAAKATGCIK